MQVIQHNPARDVIIPRKQQNKEHKVKFFSNQELKQFLDLGVFVSWYLFRVLEMLNNAFFKVNIRPRKS